MKSRLLCGLSASILIFLSTATSATLVDNGGGLIYDTVLNITWAPPDGATSWDQANTWASELTLGGVSGWRLPYISVAAGAGPFSGSPVDCSTATESACRDNELGYMFYHNLGGTSGQPVQDSGDPDLALFPTLDTDPTSKSNQAYWSGTEFDSLDAWILIFGHGGQGFSSKVCANSCPNFWAVHAGNVVPVPAAVWLFGSGLLGLIGIARKKA